VLQAKQANDTQCAALQERLDVLSERCTSLQERCETLSTQREELLVAVSSAEQDATSALKLLEAEKAHHAEAIAKLKEMLATETDNLKLQLTVSEHVIVEQKIRNEDGSKRFETLSSEFDSMRTAIAGKDAEINDLTAQVSEMEDKLEEQQKLYTQAMSSAETALVEAQRRQRELTHEKTTLEMALTEAMDEQQRLESELRTAREDSEQTTKLRTEAENAVAHLQTHLEELQRVMEEKVSNIEQERANIEQERDHALSTLRELEPSASSAGASSVKGQDSSVAPSASSAGASSVKGSSSSPTKSPTKSPSTKTAQAPRLVVNNPPFGFGPFIQYPGGTMRR
jgi:chromosome segregation ATPase